jgi:hypothetical protein
MHNFSTKSEGTNPLGRHGCRWEYNIKTDTKEMSCGSVGWIKLAKDRTLCGALLKIMINFWLPQKAGNLLTG